MPVAICRIIANSVALPNVYQYDAPPGTSSVRKSLSCVTAPVRWSSQVNICAVTPSADSLDDHRRRVELVFDPRDLHFALVVAERKRVEAAQRGPRLVLAELAVDRTVAGADEFVLSRIPGELAAEVRADRAEDREAHGDDGIRDLVGAAEELRPRLTHLLVGRFHGPDELLGVAAPEVPVRLVHVEDDFRRLVRGLLERVGLMGRERRPLVVRGVGGRGEGRQ